MAGNGDYVSQLLPDEEQAIMLRDVLVAAATGLPMPDLTDDQKTDAALLLAKLLTDLRKHRRRA